MLTRQYHWDTEKAWDARADETEAACPPSTQQLPVHHEHADDVRRDFQRSRYKRVDVNIAMESSSVQGQSIVDKTACHPTVTALTLSVML